MRPVPIPDGFAEDQGGVRVIIGDDPTRDDVRPAEYIRRPSKMWEDGFAYSALVVLEPDDLEKIAAGARYLWLTLDGAEVPWSLGIAL